MTGRILNTDATTVQYKCDADGCNAHITLRSMGKYKTHEQEKRRLEKKDWYHKVVRPGKAIDMCPLHNPYKER